MYDYVAELSCCAKSEQNRLPQFCWGDRENLSCFTHTHTQSVKQILSSRLQITKMEGSETFMAQNAWFTPRCAFLGVAYRWWQIMFRGPNPPETHFGTIQCKTYYRESSKMLKLYSYHRLRGSASTVLTATGQVNGRWRILTLHRIETHESTATKFGTIDYVYERTP